MHIFSFLHLLSLSFSSGRLRNFAFYIVWVIIGAGQLVIYSYLKDNADFSYWRGDAFSGFKALLPALLVFQLLRVPLFKIQGREFIVVMSHKYSMWDEDEKRKLTWLEVIFTMLIVATILTFNSI